MNTRQVAANNGTVSILVQEIKNIFERMEEAMDSAIHWNAQQQHHQTHIQPMTSHTIANTLNFIPIDGAK